ncbi:MAG: tetratricopeptide repeat protein [Chitinivibrionales bacterium]|nr:tetratricopeptide repeat protein [Chitinivibrionales bacterium]
MKTRALFASLFCALTITGPLSAAPGNTSGIRLLLTRPVDVSYEKSSENRWFSALSVELLHFRLSALQHVETVSPESLIAVFPSYANFNKEITEKEYAALAKELGCTHMISQKYELTDGGKGVQYYAEIISGRGNKIVNTVERSFPLTEAGKQLDTCTIEIFRGFNIKVPKDLERFFYFSMLSSEPKNIQELGEAILMWKYSGPGKELQAAQAFQAIIDKDSRMEFAYYLGAQAYAGAGRYNRAVELYHNFFEIIPDYVPLYREFARSLRLANKLEEAAEIATRGERRAPESIPLLLEKARILEDMGKLIGAEKTYQRILEIDRTQAQALLFFAKYYNEKGKPDDALKYANEAIKYSKNNGRAYFEKGRSLKILTTYKDAIIAFKKAAAFAPDDPQPRIALGDVYMQLEEYENAAAQYEEAMKKMPNDFEIHNKAAKAHHLAGNVTRAADILKKVEPRFSTNSVLQKELGLQEFLLGDTANARRHLEKSFEKEQNDWRVLMRLGDIYTQSGRFDEAFKMYNMAMPIIEDKNACRIALARLYIAKRAPSQATTYLKQVYDSDPTYPSVNRYLGDARLQANDKKQALQFYLKERELHGAESYTQNQIAWLYFDAQDWHKAQKEYLKLINMGVKDAEPLFRLGIVYLHLNNTSEAEKYIAQGHAQGKADQEIYYQLGIGYVSVGIYEKAIDAFWNCVKRAPTREDGWLKLAGSYIQNNNDTAAAEAYVKVFNLNNEKYKDLLAQAGHIYYKYKMKEEAKRTYSLFIEKRFVDYEVNAKLARIEYAEKNYLRVIELLKDIEGEWASDMIVRMMLAESYYATNQYAQAIKELHKVLAKNPDHVRAVELAALANEKAGNLSQSCAMYEKYLEFSDEGNHQDYSFHLGELYEKQQRLSEAIQRYRENIEAYPEDLRNFERLSSLHFAAKDWPKAETVLSQAVKLPQVPSKFFKMLALTFENLNNNVEAIQWYEHYLTMEPADSTAWRRLGTIYFNGRQYMKAISPLEMAVKHLPQSYDCLRMLGISHYEANQIDQAVAPLSRAHAIRSDALEIIKLLAQCYRHQNDNSNLIAILKKWTALDKKVFDIRLELGTLLLEAGKPAEAITVLNEAAKINRSEARTYTIIAQCYEKLGENSKRLKNLKTALGYSEDNFEVNFELARYYIEHDNDKMAETHLRIALTRNNLHARSHFEFGKIMLRKNDTRNALQHFDMARKYDADNMNYLAHYAYAASLENKTQSALAAVENAVTTTTRDVDVLYLGGLVYKNAGQTVKSKQLLRKAISTDDKCAKCYHALGEAYVIEANYKQAVKALMTAWELGGYNEKVILMLSRALSIDGKYTEAKDFLSLILKKNGDNHEALYEYTHILLREGRIDEAKKAVRTYEKKEKSGWTHCAQGEIHEAEGEIDAAWISFNVALRLLPEEPRVLSACGRIYLDKREYNEAVVHFSQALAQDPNNPDFLINLGKAYEGMNDLNAARELSESVAQRFPHNEDAHYLTAKIMSRRREHHKALNIIQQGLVHNPKSAQLNYIAGHEYAALGQFQNAIESYNRAIEFGDNNFVEVYRHLGNLYYEHLKDTESARASFQKYIKAGGKNVEVRRILNEIGS